MLLTITEKEAIIKLRKKNNSMLKRAKKDYLLENKPLENTSSFLAYIVQNSGLTHRDIQEAMGQKSSGFVANILCGKKRLTNKHAVNLANACGMTQAEKVEFYEGVLNKK